MEIQNHRMANTFKILLICILSEYITHSYILSSINSIYYIILDKLKGDKAENNDQNWVY